MRSRRGAALILAVLLSLAAVLLAHAALLLARYDYVAAAAGRRSLALEVTARSAALAVLQVQSVQPPADVSFPGRTESMSGTAGDVAWTAWARRVAAETWLAEGAAEARDGRRHLVVPFWRLDPTARVRAQRAVVEVGSASGGWGNGVDESRWTVQPEALPPGGCAAEDVTAGEPLPAWDLIPDSLPPALGLLSMDSLAARAPLAVAGVGTPGPYEAFGACVEGVWNWGDPLGTDTPCADRTGFVLLADGALLAGGVGQGLFVAEGDLHVVDSELYGLILAGGTVRLEGSARLVGAIRAARGVELGTSAEVVGSRCWVRSALSHQELLAPIPVPEARWITGG